VRSFPPTHNFIRSRSPHNRHTVLNAGGALRLRQGPRAGLFKNVKDIDDYHIVICSGSSACITAAQVSASACLYDDATALSLHTACPAPFGNVR
jgi:hypothetical protein